jgi:hypothetical protein
MLGRQLTFCLALFILLTPILAAMIPISASSTIQGDPWPPEPPPACGDMFIISTPIGWGISCEGECEGEGSCQSRTGEDDVGSYAFCGCGPEDEAACCHMILRGAGSGTATPDATGDCGGECPGSGACTSKTRYIWFWPYGPVREHYAHCG